MRIHAGLAVVAVAAGAVLRLPPPAWIAVAGAIGLVMTAELLNTAIEAAVDLASPADHPLAKRAKDVAAAAVLTASATAAATGVLVVIWALGRK